MESGILQGFRFLFKKFSAGFSGSMDLDIYSLADFAVMQFFLLKAR